MKHLEYSYIKSLTLNLIFNNKNIYNSYIDFLREHYPLAYIDLNNNQSLHKIYEPMVLEEIEYCPEIVANMVMLMKYIRNNYSSLQEKDIFDEISQEDKDTIFYYMWRVLNIDIKPESIHIKDKALHDYQLSDGVLKKVEYRQNTCYLHLTDILYYTYNDITSKNIIIKFDGISKFSIDGNIFLEEGQYNLVRDTHSCKLSDTDYCYEVLCTHCEEPIIISIVYKNVAINRPEQLESL